MTPELITSSIPALVIIGIVIIFIIIFLISVNNNPLGTKPITKGIGHVIESIVNFFRWLGSGAKKGIRDLNDANLSKLKISNDQNKIFNNEMEKLLTDLKTTYSLIEKESKDMDENIKKSEMRIIEIQSLKYPMLPEGEKKGIINFLKERKRKKDNNKQIYSLDKEIMILNDETKRKETIINEKKKDMELTINKLLNSFEIYKKISK